MKTVALYILLFFFYSAGGWLGESVYCSVPVRRWVNRGFLTGPLCPIYGTGAIAMALTLTPVKAVSLHIGSVSVTPLLVFLAGIAVCDTVEFITSILMEKLFHARWWDYSDKPFNIQGRICLGHSVYWGIAAILFIYLVHPFVLRIFAHLSGTVMYVVLAAVLVIFAVDLLSAIIKAADIRKLINSFHRVGQIISEHTENLRASFGKSTQELVDRFDDVLKKLESLKDEVSQNMQSVMSIYEKSLSGDKKKKANRFIRINPSLEKIVRTKYEQLEKKAKELREMIEKTLNR